MWRTTEEVGRQHQGIDMPGVCGQVPEGGREREQTGCEVICGAPMTFAVKGLMTTVNLFLLSHITYD